MLWFEGTEKGSTGSSSLWLRVRNYEQYPNFFIGPDPCSDPFTKKEADEIDIVINVGDNEYTFAQGPSRPGQQVYWYPLIEMGKWHYSTLFPLFKILDRAHEQKLKVYIHCAAGAYRSPGIFQLWLQSRSADYSFLNTAHKDYVENHCGDEFYVFCSRWRRLQKEGKQYSLSSIMMQFVPRVGYKDDQLFFGMYKKDTKEWKRRKGLLTFWEKLFY